MTKKDAINEMIRTGRQAKGIERQITTRREQGLPTGNQQYAVSRLRRRQEDATITLLRAGATPAELTDILTRNHLR